MPLNYLEWNDLLAENFFYEEMASREVILFGDVDLINKLGKPYGSDFYDFITKLKKGPDYIHQNYTDIYRMAYETYRNRKNFDFPYPPYVAYLVLFVCAATIEGEFNVNAYYPRLKKLLGNHDEISINHNIVPRMARLWSGLEFWSKNIKGEELGRFTKRVRGGNVHVGIPLSQTIISEEERKKLPHVFSKSNLDPNDLPSEETLKHKLKTNGEQFLKRRTISLLNTSEEGEKQLVNAFIDFVLEELENWDGRFENEVNEGGSTHRTTVAKTPQHQEVTNVYIRICLKQDFGMYSQSLRIKTKNQYPENDLEFRIEGFNGTLTCFETSQPGWSSRLEKNVDDIEGTSDVFQFDWLKGDKIFDHENKWAAKLRPANVRVFLPGRWEGLDEDWIEAQHLEYGCEFFVACHGSTSEEVLEWGNRYTDFFEAVNGNAFPSEWSLFHGKNAKQSNNKYDVLTLPQNVHLRVRGGVKVGKGNQYLYFAPPYIVLEGSKGDEVIRLDDIEISRDQNENDLRYELPKNLEAGKTLAIQVTKNGDKICHTRTIRLIKPVLTEDFSKVPKRDKFGDIIDDNFTLNDYVQGAVVYGQSSEWFRDVPTSLPTYLSNIIIFIGLIPGQIVKWPGEDLPIGWEPVWAISKSKRDLEVHFCGKREYVDKIPSKKSTCDVKKTKEWKKYIFTNRKTNKIPSLPRLKELWKKYEMVAENVR